MRALGRAPHRLPPPAEAASDPTRLRAVFLAVGDRLGDAARDVWRLQNLIVGPRGPRVGVALLVWATSCDGIPEGPALSREAGRLRLGRQVPALRERDVIGAVRDRVERRSRAFRRLVRVRDDYLLFKDEEDTGADRMMTRRAAAKTRRLGQLVARQWPGVKLRITEAWDEDGEHGPGSAHYEGRAVDLTTSDLDTTKLGRLGGLAVEAGFDWVYFEDRTHIHASVRR